MLQLLFGLSLLIASSQAEWSSYHDPHFVGNRTTIVQMHEWRFDDLANECEQFLGPKQFGGIHVSPVNEYALIDKPWFRPEARRPWFERYQPVSYRICSRSGDETAFADMLHRCNLAGVRVYIDVVLNHMTGGQNGVGVCGTEFRGSDFDYPGVPFRREHFNSKEKCGTEDGGIHDYNNAHQARECELSGLRDLDQTQEYVKNKQQEFLNNLIRLGVAGFRVDASKHIWPHALKNIFDGLNNLNRSYFGENARPFAMHEVTPSSGEISVEEYTQVGKVIEFRYFDNMQSIFRKYPNRYLASLSQFGRSWGFLDDNDAVAVMDNHDIQRGDNGDFSKVITYRQSRWLKMSSAFMLAWPYGTVKLLSSYYWPEYKNQEGHDVNNWWGPPHEDNFEIKHYSVNSDQTCGNGWICEHRWRQIENMVGFRNVVTGRPVRKWWSNGFHQIAFAREGRGFIAINNEDFPMKVALPTTLPEGLYCDVITGYLKENKCTGRKVYVTESGDAVIEVGNNTQDPILAIHVDAKVRL